MLPSLFEAVAKDNVQVIPAVIGGEDFSFYVIEVPTLFYCVGNFVAGDTTRPSHHSPEFLAQQGDMIYGVKALLLLSLDHMDHIRGQMTGLK